MSELITTQPRANIRLRLLATVSALTLLTVVTSQANAEDADRPTVWIELGGQLESMDSGQQQFAPPFIVATPRPAPETVSPLSVGHSPRHSFGGEGKISFEPENTDWVFSAAVRFGRSTARKHLHQQSYPTHPVVVFTAFPSYVFPYQYVLPFSDASRQDSESHVVLDFQAGRDVGVGMFGQNGSSIFSVGVRFAQFGSQSQTAFKSDPDGHPLFEYIGPYAFPAGALYHFNVATAATTRSFHGFGPSISWNASASLAGNPDDMEIAVDWGVNAAVLFGRQKATVHHQTTAQFHSGLYSRGTYGIFRTTLYRHAPPDQARSRSVIVPNIGGFAGLSFRYDAAKVSFGYRADFFFGAMDGGIDTRQSKDRNFFGPFATLSFGLGG
jgi:hypothetical protein